MDPEKENEHARGHEHHGEHSMDRREMLLSSVGGVIGGLLALTSASGCRAPQIYRDEPKGVPTGYIIDPAICTHNFDCQRVCPCDAVGFSVKDAEAGSDEPECRTCWINLDKCCGCGRCFRVCPDNAIVPCYGKDKIPAREIGRAPKSS